MGESVLKFPCNLFFLSFQASLFLRKALLEAGANQNCDERPALLVTAHLLCNFPVCGNMSLDEAFAAPAAQNFSLKAVTGFFAWLHLLDKSLFVRTCLLYVSFLYEMRGDQLLNTCQDVNRACKLNVFFCHWGICSFIRMPPKLHNR